MLKKVINNGCNIYIYKESFSPISEKMLDFCLIDRKNKNNEMAKNVVLI